MQLNEILLQKEKIYELANGMGFKSLRLIVDNNDVNTLNLLVCLDKDNPKARSTYSSALETELVKLFHCEVHILVESTLKPLYKESILEQSAFLEDSSKLISLYKTPLENIIFKISALTIEELNNRLAISDQIKNSLSSTLSTCQFFKVPQQTINLPNSDNDNLVCNKVFSEVTKGK